MIRHLALTVLIAASAVACCSAAFADSGATTELSLQECVSMALAGHPAVSAMEQHTVQMREQLMARKGAKMPQIEWRTEALKYDWLPPNKERILGGGTTDIYTALELKTLLFSSGGAEARIDSAALSYYAAAEDLRRTRQRVALDVARAYYDVLRLRSILEARRQAVTQMEHYLRLAREKHEIGKAARLDVLRAEVQLADVTQSALIAENQVELARLALLNAMGLRQGEMDVGPRADSTPAPVYQDVTVLLDEAARKHPERLKAELQVAAAASNVKAARAEFRPKLSLVASYNREGGGIPDISNWHAGLVLNVPVFTGGVAKAEAGQAGAAEEQARAGALLVEQAVDLAVRSAALSTQDAANRLEATSRSVDLAQEAFIVAQEKYNVGLGSATEVIDTQVALVQARTNRAQALYDGKASAAAVEFAVGRDPGLEGAAVLKSTGAGEE